MSNQVIPDTYRTRWLELGLIRACRRCSPQHMYNWPCPAKGKSRRNRWTVSQDESRLRLWDGYGKQRWMPNGATALYCIVVFDMGWEITMKRNLSTKIRIMPAGPPSPSFAISRRGFSISYKKRNSRIKKKTLTPIWCNKKIGCIVVNAVRFVVPLDHKQCSLSGGFFFTRNR